MKRVLYAFLVSILGLSSASAQELSLDDANTTFASAQEFSRATSMANAGDINGDGIDDLLLGSRNCRDFTGADKDALDHGLATGCAYLVYGSNTPPSDIDLANLGSAGVLLVSGSEPGNIGTQVAGIGDFNNDGTPDFAVSGENAGPGGIVYIIFGSDSLPSVINLSDLGSLGIKIYGEANTKFGTSLSRAGDVNNDGIPDVIVGAPIAQNVTADFVADPSSQFRRRTGAVYVLFGSDSWPQTIDVIQMGNRGQFISGTAQEDRLGSSVSDAGDVNGDGIDDVVVSAFNASPAGRASAGRAAIIYGSSTPESYIHLGTLGAGGVNIYGANEHDRLGNAVSCAGDFNNDGIADVMIASERSAVGLLRDAGRVYIIYGSDSLPGTVDLDSPSTAITEVIGDSNTGFLGHAIQCVGDFNQDGTSDILIGAPKRNVDGRSQAGRSYLILGRDNPDPTFEVANFTQDDGLILNGIDPGDFSGYCVSDAGDFNGDGAPDIGICAEKASPLSRLGAGEFYVIHGNPLTAPESLTCEIDGTTRNLSWDITSEYDSIRIERDGDELVVLSGDATSFADTDPILGLVTYEVFGIRGSLSSLPASCSISIALQPPFNLNCDVINGDVVLTWEHRHPLPVDGTNIYRDGDLIATVAGDVLTYVDSAPSPGAHTYSITDFVGANVSSEVECDVIVPRAPIELSCSVDGFDVTLTWINVDNFTSVKIYRDNDPDPIAILSTGNLEMFVDRGLDPGEHSYSVQGCIGDDSSSTVSCSLTVFTAVTNLSGSSQGGDVTLTWDPPTIPGDGFVLYRDGVPIADLPADATSYVDSDLAPGDYEYEIRVSQGDDLGPPASTTVPVVASVSGLEGCAQELQVILNWTLEDTYDSIEVYKDGNLLETLAGTATSTTDTSSGAGDNTYGVVGIRGTGTSDATEVVVSTIEGPQDLLVILTDSTLHIGWNNPIVYDSILVTVNGDAQDPLAGNATNVTYPNDGLGSVNVTLRGVVNNGNCDNVSEASAGSANVIGGPSNFTCSSVNLEVSLAWTNGDSYPVVIERNGNEIHTTAADVAEYTDTVSEPGTYTYRIYGSIDGVPTLAAECVLNIPGQVEDLECTSTNGIVDLTWSNPSDNTAVQIHRNGSHLIDLPADTTSYTDNDAPSGLNTYTVRLINGDSVGSPASCEVITLLPPEIVSCSSDAGVVTVELSFPSPTAKVRIFRDGDEVTPAGGLEVTGNSASFEDDPLLPGTYTYEAIAVGDTGSESAVSDTCESEVPAPPVQLTCSAADGEGNLNWVLNRSYDSIDIFRNGTLIDSVAGNATLYSDPDSPLQAGDYVYEIVGVVGDSRSEADSCEMTIFPPIEDLNCSQTGDTINLSWTNAGSAPTITIHRNGDLIETLDGSESQYEDPGLSTNVYSYEIRNGDGDVIGVPVECAVDMINPISDLSCVPGDDQMVELSWTLGNTYDRINLSVFLNNNFVEEQELAGNATSVTLTDLDAGEYRFEFIAHRGDNSSSQASCEAQVYTPVFNFTCKVDNRIDVSLMWENGNPYDEIVITRTRESDGDEVVFDNLPGSLMAFTDSMIDNGTYTYIVTGITNGVGVDSLPCEVTVDEVRFSRGEVNNDGRFDISDAVYILNWKFRGLPEPTCLDAADTNDDGVEDIIDAMYIINWQYRGGANPEPPFLFCGIDPTDDDPLDCQFFPEGSCP